MPVGVSIQQIVTMVAKFKIDAMRSRWTKDVELSTWILIDEPRPVTYDIFAIAFLHNNIP
jgi:hypothetical protein